MDLSDLLIFKTVAEEGGILRAARKLHRVQSNVTTRIKQLKNQSARNCSFATGNGSCSLPEESRCWPTPISCCVLLTRRARLCQGNRLPARSGLAL